jgi:hypothetical protein
MPSKKLLNGLPHDIIKPYMSTLCFYKKGYMANWLVNGAKLLEINEVEIDLLNQMITPDSMDIPALKHYLPQMKNTIASKLKANNFDENFIKIAKLHFRIDDWSSRTIDCTAELRDLDGRVYKYTFKEEAYEQFFEVFRDS